MCDDSKRSYYLYGKQRKALDTGRKNVKTDASTWQRIENVHEPIIDKDTFYKTRERMEHIKKKHLEASKPKADVPNKPDNILVYLIDYVLVYDNEHIEIRWNFDDFQAG